MRGELTIADGDVFARTISGASNGIVILQGPGGSLLAGIRIGTLIRLNGFDTAVSNGTYCASACAFAWLAGETRYVGGNGSVGFHAAYRVENGRNLETGAGNALVGAYLDRLGLNYDAIIFVTSAPPDSINWLTPSQAKNLGISVAYISPETLQAQPRPRPPARLPEPPQMEDRKSGLEAAAHAFPNQYFSHWSERNDDALAYFAKIYAPKINFAGHSIQRDRLLEQKRRFADRWPQRIYTARQDSIRNECTQDGQCTIRGTVEWDCRSTADSEVSRGTADFTLQVSFSADFEPQVTGEWSYVRK